MLRFLNLFIIKFWKNDVAYVSVLKIILLMTFFYHLATIILCEKVST